MQKKLELLKKIARRFNCSGITWVLGASMLLYFKGIVSEFNDIDLMVAVEDIAAARNILGSLGRLLPGKANEGYATKYFLEYDIDGVEVDIMAGFAIISGGEVHDCSLEAGQIIEYACLDGERIPLQGVERWRGYYSLMGREAKVRLIDAYLGKERQG